LPHCTIDLKFARFKNGAKQAAKRHKSFSNSLQETFKELEKDFSLCGDRIPNMGPSLHVRKIRIGVPEEWIKPRDGYRLIVQVIETDHGVTIKCLDLYYKKEQSNISSREIKKLIKASDRPAE
jgi:hypothetical protein